MADGASLRQTEQPAGYLELIRENVQFRRLWLGNVVSLFGDWFNTIALYALILQLTGSEFALGAVFISKMLPWALASPLAGILVDRFDRRKAMIVSDLIRAVIVLGFLLVDEPHEVFLIYLLTTVQVVVGSVFHPAQSASIPNVTRKQDLVTANAIMSATWSVLLAFGAAAGGFAAEYLGLKAVFILDSVSYLLSAWFIYRTVIPQYRPDKPPASLLRTAHKEVVQGWTYLRQHPAIQRMATVKMFWAIGGGGLVYMLALVGDEMDPERQAASIGLVFAARGVGTGIGPIAARMLFKDESKWAVVIGSSMAITGLGYFLLGAIPWTWLVIFPVILAHVAGGTNWVLSTVLLQRRATDQFRGRVFATEWLFVMGMETLSIVLASLILEMGLFSLRSTVMGFGMASILIGLIWLVRAVPSEKLDYHTGNIPEG